MLGLGPGPLVIGVLSDFLAPEYGGDSLRYALLITTTFAGLAAICAFLAGSRYLKSDLERSQDIA